jgi:16S rRNA processing protein RimM
MVAGKPDLVCVAEITAAHGVRGLVRLRPFTESPEGVLAYGDPTDVQGKQTFKIELRSWSKGSWIAAVEGINDRNAAEKLRGTRFFVPRDRLPPPDDDEEFYYHDLNGLAAIRPDGSEFGRVRSVANYGAGDILAIDTVDAGTIFVPFTRQAVPVVDIAGGRVVVDPPTMTGAGEDNEEGSGNEGPDGR